MYVTPEIIYEVAGCCHCAIIYDSDKDFGTVSLIEPEAYTQLVVLPRAKIDSEKLAHLCFFFLVVTMCTTSCPLTTSWQFFFSRYRPGTIEHSP